MNKPTVVSPDINSPEYKAYYELHNERMQYPYVSTLCELGEQAHCRFNIYRYVDADDKGVGQLKGFNPGYTFDIQRLNGIYNVSREKVAYAMRKALRVSGACKVDDCVKVTPEGVWVSEYALDMLYSRAFVQSDNNPQQMAGKTPFDFPPDYSADAGAFIDALSEGTEILAGLKQRAFDKKWQKISR